jgi:UDP-N-acetyl-D-mannosaminuronate dehydrogenase
MNGDNARGRLVDAIRDRTARLAVIGQGYVGLPLAVELGPAGYSVVRIDADPDPVAAITIGQAPTPDIASESLPTLLDQGRYVIGDAVLKAVPASDENIAAADCVVVLTDHPDFDYAGVSELAPLVRDSRSAIWGLPGPNARIVRL